MHDAQHRAADRHAQRVQRNQIADLAHGHVQRRRQRRHHAGHHELGRGQGEDRQTQQVDDERDVCFLAHTLTIIP